MFGCGECGARLTAAVSEVALPAHAALRGGHDLLPPLLEPGSYAVDPRPYGPPWQQWEDLGAERAAERGLFAPLWGISDGPTGTVVLAPGDVGGVVLVPQWCGEGCLGVGGADRPNLACAECGLPVGSRIDDCGQWQAVRLDPRAVRRLPGAPSEPAPAGWEEITGEDRALPPVEPRGWWSDRWQAATGAALAHVAAASGGRPVAVVDPQAAPYLERALAALLPGGEPERRLALAGPGLGVPDAELLLVPLHPQSGEVWAPPGGGGEAVLVPLAAEVWAWLVSPGERSRLPVVGGLPEGVERDDPLPLRPVWVFEPSRQVFREVLAWMPAVREPWLRAVFDRAWRSPWMA
ncbi:hypothetical protein [Kitasatospora terrestris]|uniref:hypothetical protein n=1 Tax=Kitasatospora terrestris TaxID=258051 RepID=UPI0031E6EBAB